MPKTARTQSDKGRQRDAQGGNGNRQAHTEANPRLDPLTSVLNLQRMAGNQAVNQLLTGAVGENNLPQGSGASRKHNFRGISASMQAPMAIQKKLKVSTPGDRYEQEADRVAEQVMRMPEPQVQRACACGGGYTKCWVGQVTSMTSATTLNVQHQSTERAMAQPNLLESLTRNAHATPATAPEVIVQPKLSIGSQTESLSLIQRQTESLDDQGDCSGWERDCESFCIRAARQYWIDVDGVQPPAVKGVDCMTPFIDPDGKPLRGLCIATYEGGLRVSVARTSPGKALEIWRTRSPTNYYAGPSCKYEYHCTIKDNSLVLKRISCSVPQPQLPEQEQYESKTSSPLQRYPAHQSRFSQPPSIVHEVLNSPGQPLNPVTSTFMESRFGHDFSQVRVHADSRAVQLAQALNARAFTVGCDIVFGAGQYDPQSFEGKRLIAHELTHVLQQSNEKSVIRRKIQFNSPNYMRENPIGRILSDKSVGFTTPTVNGSPLPDNFNRAGELAFQALQPKRTNYSSKTKECTFKDFDVKVSANVIIPAKPEDGRWTMEFPGPRITGTPACRDKENVPVVMTGKPSSEAVGKWIEKNEEEHVDDLKGLYQKYIKPHFDWLLKLKANGEDAKKCQEALIKAIGDKDGIVIRDFLNDLSKAVRKRDEGGKHTLSNKIRVKKNCSGVEIESSVK